MAEDRFLLKDLFDEASVGAIASAVADAARGVDAEQIVAMVFDSEWDGRELKERMRHIAHVLADLVPGDYRTKLTVLLEAAANTAPGFPAMVYSDFVEAYGTHDWEASVAALERFTTLVSAEFAIRPFIRTYPNRTLALMEQWAQAPDPALRRLASEGCRPRLPWGMRLDSLVADPSPVLPILELLRDDGDDAVRRSVANNLNDISKDHPTVVVSVLRTWLDVPTAHTGSLARHALRTLLKRGDRDALALMGYSPDPEVEMLALAVEPPAVAIGGDAGFSFVLRSTGSGPQPLMVDYAIHYVKSNGTTSPKVFKLRTLTLDTGEQAAFQRRVGFRQLSTRTHRPGSHRFEVLANGTSLGSVEFTLIA